MERLDIDERSSLLGLFVGDEEKKGSYLTTGINVIKLFWHNLRCYLRMSEIATLEQMNSMGLNRMMTEISGTRLFLKISVKYCS